MIATKFFIVSLVHLIVETNCNGDGGSSVYTSFDAANSTIDVIGNETTETHHTTCKITTERLVANAQASFTRVLTGACNAKTLDERFEKLENSMNKRLHEIKELIVRATSKTWDSTENVESGSSKNRVHYDNANTPDAIVVKNFEKIVDERTLPRENEVAIFNNSIRELSTSDDQKAYRYYWRVSNVIEKLLQWKTGRSERSSTFHVGNYGYAMYLKFTPKYFPDGTIFLSVGLTEGPHDSKLVWPFPLRVRIEILDLSMDDEPEDRGSRLWDPSTICSSYFWGRPGARGISDNPECVGLSVPRQLLVGDNPRNFPNSQDYPTSDGSYISNDSLLVKLTVYL